MRLSAHEREIYYLLGIFSVVDDLLADLFFSAPQFMDPESELPFTIDAATVLEIRDVWSCVSRVRTRLIGMDKRRQLWAEAVDCLPYKEAADFHEMHAAIMMHVTSDRWAPHFCKAVLTELRDIARTSPPATFAAWQRATAERRA
jgi:hypothetical protein